MKGKGGVGREVSPGRGPWVERELGTLEEGFCKGREEYMAGDKSGGLDGGKTLWGRGGSCYKCFIENMPRCSDSVEESFPQTEASRRDF